MHAHKGKAKTKLFTSTLAFFILYFPVLQGFVSVLGPLWLLFKGPGGLKSGRSPGKRLVDTFYLAILFCCFVELGDTATHSRCYHSPARPSLPAFDFPFTKTTLCPFHVPIYFCIPERQPERHPEREARSEKREVIRLGGNS
ncbi:MAG: hypothetical protein BYD32DRAFT_426907 [Podila humilis]|nr:MAG: hypothetical protein BYD32DRAFT_426907 [Podila humilis]